MGGDRKEIKLITPEKAGERLSVSPVTIRKWLRQGKLRGTKIFGSGWRVREDEIDRFIKKTEEETL
ncbi:helix-turn-helix domain-containing protein [Melghirimyces algeriensis]|uniref:DNA binding domain-containing protein, excisionase family n=1 Tax=Melghirimyces algeriensis TaxID=910412 RepID=A0A521DPD4_9BACL|nr:helix-turn-helix domain-containing protein [Melghirimyces algeriensis]SMO73566.1 DNA binding domain-containing protein, excisionase family [Melghirimyces algeriensis]